MGKTNAIPHWLRRPIGERVSRGNIRNAVAELNTVCEEARCPNRGICLGEQGTATFLILGPGCTRSCSFCSVKKDLTPVNRNEPEIVARAVNSMALDYVVLTSTTRDDLSNGGASIFAETVNAIRKESPEVPVEVLVPDFGGSERAIDTVLGKDIAVFGHNVETVPRLYAKIRKGADYNKSLGILRYTARKGALTKSALILGMGETDSEVIQTLNDLKNVGVRLVIIGQYFQPTAEQIPVSRFLTPGEFEGWQKFAVDLGFAECLSGPFVRSSYNAAKLYSMFVK